MGWLEWTVVGFAIVAALGALTFFLGALIPTWAELAGFWTMVGAIAVILLLVILRHEGVW